MSRDVQIVITRLKDDIYKVTIHSRSSVTASYSGRYKEVLDFVEINMASLDTLDQ